MCSSSKRKWKYYDLIPRPSAFGEFNDDVYPILATGAHFLENDDACLISYLHNGFWELKLDTWESISRWGPRDSYDLGDSRRHFGRISVVAANLCQGLDWFKIMPDRLKKMSTTHQPQQINIPLPVLFINHGQAVIMGSTNGCAVILEVKHGEKVQALKHGSDQTWVTSLREVFLQVFPIMDCDTKDCIISAILWLWTPQWREASTALGIYFTKPTLPATPSPSLRPVITSSPLTTKSRRLLEILEDLLPVFDYKNAFACATFLDTGNMSSSIHCRCIGVIVMITLPTAVTIRPTKNEELVHASTIQGLNVIVNQWYSHDGRQKEILLYLSLGMYFFIDCNQELNRTNQPYSESANEGTCKDRNVHSSLQGSALLSKVAQGTCVQQDVSKSIIFLLGCKGLRRRDWKKDTNTHHIVSAGEEEISTNLEAVLVGHALALVLDEDQRNTR
ncbi:hypothetical protein DFJ43DRAFT_1041829 [Lentinula guzmanii]|uniref:Uncharacterized protein n=1 Tax=Lentinula guzmanii TaxID=2804957 RepID=A0AA38JEF1_9AGAR|nr:hypothetical protein DFJ43DRAFT_1041829 [Lentinula guzmanii]